MEFCSAFNSALWPVAPKIKSILNSLDEEVKETVYEIRLRKNRPVVLYGRNGNQFLCKNSTVSKFVCDDTYIMSEQELNETFNRVCGYSVHTYQQDINNGFITLNGGHRVGVCGTAVCNGQGEIISIKDVSSLNIRIARKVNGCSNDIVEKLIKNKNKSIIIAGPPTSGKTTLLKDLSISLSTGRITEMKKVALIDERSELLSDMSINYSDALISYPKDKAIMIAMRTLSPEYIITDEVGCKADIEAIVQGVNTGINFIITVHSYDVDDFLNRPQTQALLETRCFDNVILLKSDSKPCEIKEIYDAEDLLYEVYNRRVGIANDDLYRTECFSLLQRSDKPS